MSFDNHLLFASLCVFARCTSMLMSAPLFGTTVPVQIRVMFGVVLTLSLVPVVQSHVGPLPPDLMSLFLAVLREVLVGLLLGGLLQFLVAAVQMAGAFLDVQVGTGSAQVFNPFLGTTTSPIAQFKVMLATVLVFLLNGHRMMIAAFVRSYDMPGPTLAPVQSEVLSFIGQMAMLSLQIAAPVAAVTVIIDVAAGIVNKAVPQTQPFLLSLPAKLAFGMVLLAIGLPALVAAVQGGLDITFDHLGHMLRGG